MFDLISIGDCVIDTYIPLTDAGIEATRKRKKLVLSYGQKIPVGPSVEMVAGNAANNAIGVSRLKLKSAIYANLGNDHDGKRVIEKLKTEKVDTRYLVADKSLPSNHNIILDYKGERTILSYHQPWKYNLPDLDRTKWVYLTSMSPSYVDSSILEQIVNYLERTGARLSFNPGTYQLKQGVKKLSKLLFLTELLILNLEESKILLGHLPTTDIPVKNLLKQIADLGPRNVVITDGEEGSFGYDGKKCYKLAIFPAKLVEMTGCGDAYASGCTAALFYGETLNKAMRWGAANGSSVAEYVGPHEGLLTFDQMHERLSKYSKIGAKLI